MGSFASFLPAQRGIALSTTDDETRTTFVAPPRPATSQWEISRLISRWSDPSRFAPGARVVVRSRLTPEEAADSGKKVSDIIGTITALDPLHILDAHGVDHTVDPLRVLIIKLLPAQTVRNSQIRAVEQATAQAFPGIEHVDVNGWLLRAGDGITERSNSAAPIGPQAVFSSLPLAEIEEFYTRHNLPVRLHVPDRIGAAAERLIATQPARWEHGPEVVVMTKALHHDELDLPTMPEGYEYFSRFQPDDQWLKLYHFRGQPLPEHALRLLMNSLDGDMTFCGLTDEHGETVAITRATITTDEAGGRWLGLSAVEVDPAHRRRGLGTALERAVLTWGLEHGAQHAFLQAVASNHAGIAMYGRLGFAEHHRHRCFTRID